MAHKYTGMNLCHYAAEYGCTQFLKALAFVFGESKMLFLFTRQSANGMNGYHFLAQNCHFKPLKFIVKSVLKLPTDLSSEMDRSEGHMASQDSNSSTTLEKATNALTLTNNEKRNIFHFALNKAGSINERRLMLFLRYCVKICQKFNCSVIDLLCQNDSQQFCPIELILRKSLLPLFKFLLRQEPRLV